LSVEEDTETGSPVFRHNASTQPRRNWQSRLIGTPLATADAPHETVGKLIGLAIFSSDALSSVAYAPQEMMIVLASVGTGALSLSIPLSLAIAGLLAVLVTSYEQTIHAYPSGGGAYIVARDNFGDTPGLVAAAALLIDYVLTVSVSISSGVAQLVSAFPLLTPYRVPLAVLFVVGIMVVNLRGVRESGRIFAIPTYLFIFAMAATILTAFVQYFTGNLLMVAKPPTDLLTQVGQPLSLFLILRAFSSGTSALTGTEAISNGIQAFKEPKVENAALTLIYMGLILGSMMVGITFLANRMGALPSETETVISQMTRTVFGGTGVLYLVVIFATTVILIMAANTSFADFPRLSAFVARDGFLPRQMTYRGSRLVYSNGIIALAAVAILLIVVFQASVTSLIPLYAVGVFVSFTLSQAGMARRWWISGHLAPGEKVQRSFGVLEHDPGWHWKMFVNGLGAVITFVVALIFAVTKFTGGAWIVILLIPAFVSLFMAIHRHYRHVAQKLSLDNYASAPQNPRQRVIMLIGGVHQGTLAGLRFAKTLSDDITAVHVSVDPDEAESIQKKWELWGEGVRLVVIESPYRLLIEPLLEYIDEIYKESSARNEFLTILVPQFVSRHWWSGLLHMRTAETLSRVLLNLPGVVVIEVPHSVD
jgi:amino acid transporter